MKWQPNRNVFTKVHITKDNPLAPTICVYADHPALHACCPIEVTQDANDLSNVFVRAHASFGHDLKDYPGTEWSETATYEGNVTCTRVGETMVEITGTQRYNGVETHTIHLWVSKDVLESTDDNEVLVYDGTITTKRVEDGLTTYEVSVSFEDVGAYHKTQEADGSWTYIDDSKVTSGSATYRYKDIDESIKTDHYTMKSGSKNNNANVNLTVKVPGED